MRTNPYPEWHQKLLEAGWTHDFTRASGHHRYRPPLGVAHRPVIWGSSPKTNGRGFENTKREVARALASTKAVTDAD